MPPSKVMAVASEPPLRNSRRETSERGSFELAFIDLTSVSILTHYCRSSGGNVTPPTLVARPGPQDRRLTACNPWFRLDRAGWRGGRRSTVSSSCWRHRLDGARLQRWLRLVQAASRSRLVQPVELIPGW